MLGSTAPSSVWVQFDVGCYSSEGPAEPVCLAVVGSPGPVGTTVNNGQEKLLWDGFLLA